MSLENKLMYRPDQKAWCELYEKATGFEPQMEGFESGESTFAESVQHNIVWFESWADEALLAITKEDQLTALGVIDLR